jgi:hypothetical protein
MWRRDVGLDTTSAQCPFGPSVEDEQATTAACLPRKTWENVAPSERPCTLIALGQSESEMKQAVAALERPAMYRFSTF